MYIASNIIIELEINSVFLKFKWVYLFNNFVVIFVFLVVVFWVSIIIVFNVKRVFLNIEVSIKLFVNVIVL